MLEFIRVLSSIWKTGEAKKAKKFQEIIENLTNSKNVS